MLKRDQYKKIPDKTMRTVHNIIHMNDDDDDYDDSKNDNLTGFLKLSHQDYYHIEINKNGEITFKNKSARDILVCLHEEINSSTINESMDDSKISKLCSRDIRRLDPFSNESCVILIRKHAVLIAVHFRAIITSKAIRLICPIGGDHILKIISDKIVEWSKQMNPDASFESHCYEVLITMGLEAIYKDYSNIKSKAIDLLIQFKKSAILDIATQEALRSLKNRVATLISQITANRQAIIDLLDDEDDIAYMQLTLLETYTHNEVDYNRIQDVQKEDTVNMMESYLDDYNAVLNMASYISLELHNAEELLMLRLDVSRNALLVADTKLSVVSISISLSSMIASMFGMNLVNHLEGSTSGFIIVFVITTIISVIVTVVTLMHFRNTNVIPK